MWWPHRQIPKEQDKRLLTASPQTPVPSRAAVFLMLWGPQPYFHCYFLTVVLLLL